LGPAFTPRSSPKTPTSSPALNKSKRSSAVDSPSYSPSKRGRKSFVQPVQNGHASKNHQRKISNDRFADYADGHDFFTTRSPRIKLKYKAPEPLITHPLHIPPLKQFDSLDDYLNSFILLDDNEDLTHEKAQLKAQYEAAIRDRIAIARNRGWLIGDGHAPAAPRRQAEPQVIPTRHDIMLKHILNFSSLMAQERRANISRAKKIAQMISQHFKKLEGTDEKEIKAEEKRIRRLAKVTAQEVRKKWKLAERVCSI
jgi:HSA